MKIYSKLLISMALILSPKFVDASPDGNKILKTIDANQSADSLIVVSSMTIHLNKNTRTMVAKTWIQGNNKSFTEYLSPAREKGTKMLKLGDELWTFYPKADRIVKIAGHMLRQSVMGSDLSYEDMMEDRKLSELYDANVGPLENYEDKPVYRLTLTAKMPNIAYSSRVILVDKEKLIPLKEELYAKSGKLLKTITVKEVKRFEKRWFPVKSTYKDNLKNGIGTEISIQEIQFNPQIAPFQFKKRALRR